MNLYTIIKKLDNLFILIYNPAFNILLLYESSEQRGFGMPNLLVNNLILNTRIELCQK